MVQYSRLVGFFSLNTLNLLLRSLLACMLSEMLDVILTFVSLQVMCCLPQALFRFLFFSFFTFCGLTKICLSVFLFLAFIFLGVCEITGSEFSV